MPTSAKKVSFESKQLRISFSKANVRVTNTHAIPQPRRERDEVPGVLDKFYTGMLCPEVHTLSL